MSIIEFQVSTPAFLAAQRNALRSLQICPPPQMVSGVLIDRIEFGNNTLRHNVLTDFPIRYKSLTSYAPGSYVEGFQTQIAQDVTVYLTTIQDILSRHNQPPVVTISLSGKLVFDLDFYALEEDCFTTTRFKVFEPGPLPALPPGLPVTMVQILSSVQSTLSTATARKAQPAGLTKLTTMFSKFLNAGVSVDSQLQRIAFRAEIGGSHPGIVTRWSDFLKGVFSDRLGGNDWSFFLDSGLINEFVKVKVNQQLAEIEVDELETFVGCSYSNAGGNAAFTLDVMGVYDLPDPLSTVVRDVALPMEISMSAPNQLKLTADYSQVIDLIHSFGIIEFLLPSLSDGLEALLQSTIGTALTDLNKQQGAPYCKKTSATVVECTRSVQMPQVTTGTVSVAKTLLALDDGFSLVGSMRSTELSPTAIRTSVREFQFRAPKVSCSAASLALVAAFQQSPSGFSVLHADAYINNDGSTPIFLCSWGVINDSLGAFPRACIRVDAGPSAIAFSMDMPVPDAAYFSSRGGRYPCDLLVRTTAGTRLLRIQPPPQITQEDINRLAAELLVKVGNCELLMSPWFEKYKPGWGLDETHIRTRVEHLWQVAITGLPAGDVISLMDSSDRELVRASAHANRALHVSALLEPAGENELKVLRRSGGIRSGSPIRDVASRTPIDGGDRGDRERGIEVGQQQLLHVGSIPLPGQCRSVHFTTVLASRCILAVLTNGIAAYEFERTERPRLLRVWEIPRIRGVVTWRGSLLYFGEEGFGWIDADGNRSAASTGCSERPIVDAVAAGKVVYALTGEGLNVYTSGLCKSGTTTEAEGARCITRTADKIVIGGRRGLAVYEADNLNHLRRGPYAEGSVTAVGRPIGTEPGTILARLEEGTARMYQIADAELQEIAMFSREPWFAGCLRTGELLVRIGSTGTTLEIGRFAASQAI